MTAVLFPGQGSQTKDMRSDVERLRPDLLELARAELDSDPFERIEEGTHFAQPAIYCASLAGWSLVDRDDVSCMAGHSLGEFSALVAAGVMSELDGLRLVALRGRLMHEAEQGGGMMAVGTPVEIAAELAGRFGLTVANDNAPEQVVLTGDGDAVDAAVEHAKAEGLRATRLRVSGAFHSPAMGAAAAELGAALDEVELGEPSVPVYCCVTTEPYGDVRRLLVEGLTSPVRWRETVLAMQRAGETRFVEVGPGKVLAGLVRRIIDSADATSLKEAARA